MLPLARSGPIYYAAYFVRQFDRAKGYRQNEGMTREEAIAILRRHELELKAAGVVSVSLFGSTARDESDPDDVDIAVRLDKNFSTGGFDYFWQREQLRENLSNLLGCKADLVEEPVRKPGFQQEINETAPLPSNKPIRRLLDIIERLKPLPPRFRCGRALS